LATVDGNTELDILSAAAASNPGRGQQADDRLK
jgi:hypothetical protein